MASKSTPGAGRRTSPASARGRRVARQRVRLRRSLARRPLQTAAGIGRSQGDAGSCDPNWGQSVIHHPPVSSRGERVPWSVRGPCSSPRSPGQLLPTAAGATATSSGGGRARFWCQSLTSRGRVHVMLTGQRRGADGASAAVRAVAVLQEPYIVRRASFRLIRGWLRGPARSAGSSVDVDPVDVALRGRRGGVRRPEAGSEAAHVARAHPEA